ncbi:MAG: glycosyltransferase family 4 protein [Capsulimonadaceae bacterium]|nr:glycosyltransferase family 4 protein [Capsulimonadaceae bacterium]
MDSGVSYVGTRLPQGVVRRGVGADRRPRVMFVSSERPATPGGMERHALRLAAGLHPYASALVFACPGKSSTEELAHEAGLDTIPYELRHTSDLKGAWCLAKAIRRHGIDIVHVHARRDFFPCVLAILMRCLVDFSFRHRPKLVLHCHQISNLARQTALTKLLFTLFADRVYGVSQAVCDRLNQRDLIVPRQAIRLLYNGIDTTRYSLSIEKTVSFRQYYRRLWGIDEDAPVIGTIGRIYDKGQETILDLMPRLLEHVPNLKYVAIGPDKDLDNTIDKFRREVDARKLTNAVIVPGPSRNDVPDMLNAFDCVIQLPQYEAFGLVLIEAGAAGLPVIVGDVGGCREVVQQDVNGLLVPSGDADAIVAAVARLFDPVSGEGERLRLGRAGREITANRFSLDDRILELALDYNSLCRI